jgi:hypothetical protein
VLNITLAQLYANLVLQAITLTATDSMGYALPEISNVPPIQMMEQAVV